MRTKRPRSLLVILAILTCVVTTLYAGGWSIITLNEYPDHAVAGERLDLTFSVRQHGNNLLDGLKPLVQASMQGAPKINVAARPTGNTGEYTATLRLPVTGEWAVSIDGSFNPEDKTRSYNAIALPPLKVVRDAASAPSLTEVERGSRLFVAKGCVGCHGTGSERDLAGKKFAADYLKKVLADPSVRTPDMPNLKLKDTEIASLTAFINRAPGKRS